VNRDRKQWEVNNAQMHAALYVVWALVIASALTVPYRIYARATRKRGSNG
jgi:hypothetical protein